MDTSERAWRLVPGQPPAPGELRAVKLGGQRLVLGQRADGALFALDNRCPHEGYPLAQGHLRDGLLTCAWHNWKFEVASGACVLGGEGVRAYPVRERDGRLEVDLTEPDPAQLVRERLASLRAGILDHDNGRALRDAVRLLQLGVDPWTVLRETVLLDARHAEYGTTHVLPVAVECGRLSGMFQGLERAHALAPSIDLCGESNQRFPARGLAAPVAHDLDTLGEALREAVEREEVERAEGLLLYALREGASIDRILELLLVPIRDHFLSFGHPLIYWVRLRELLLAHPGEGDEVLCAALLFRILHSTREDTLPYWRPYAVRVAALPAMPPPGARDEPGRVDIERIRHAVLDGSVDEAHEAVASALGGGGSAADVASALVLAAATRLLRFDERLDADPDVAEGWLWATHRFTFASAVRETIVARPGQPAPELLFQALAFVHSGRPMDREADHEGDREPVLAPAAEGGAADVAAAIRAREPARAVSLAAGLLARGEVEPLREVLSRHVLADPLVRPIFVAHAIKTTVAAFREWDALEGWPGRELPVLAAVRFLASPITERDVLQEVETSLAWVAEGRTPRKLTQ